MVRLTDFDDIGRDYYELMEMPHFDTTPWVVPKPMAESRIAIISTAGLQRRGDRPFSMDFWRLSSAARRFARGRPGHEPHLHELRSHGFQQDHNVVFPIDRLNELAAEGVVGSVASVHYSFMGATHPAKLERTARQLAGMLKQDQVDAVLLVPV